MSRLALQLEKQRRHGDNLPFADTNEGRELRAKYILTHAYALCDEVHEATGEAGWKPWATSRHLNRKQFLDEVADATLFLENMVLAALRPDQTVADLQAEYDDLVLKKITRSVRRQEDGYDGVSSKCKCGRERDDASLVKAGGQTLMMCPCGEAWLA